MRKTDIIAFILLMVLNIYYLRIIYLFDYYSNAYADSFKAVIGNLFTLINTIASALIIYPRISAYLHKREKKSKLGSLDPKIFLNYHSGDCEV